MSVLAATTRPVSGAILAAAKRIGASSEWTPENVISHLMHAI
jgi:hypothetical protein